MLQKDIPSPSNECTAAIRGGTKRVVENYLVFLVGLSAISKKPVRGSSPTWQLLSQAPRLRGLMETVLRINIYAAIGSRSSRIAIPKGCRHVQYDLMIEAYM